MAGTLGTTTTAEAARSQLVAREGATQSPGTLAKGEDLARGALLGQVDNALRVYHGEVTGGPFQADETVTGGTSGATGAVEAVGDGYLDLETITGTFAAEEAITGGTSSATATVTLVAEDTYKFRAFAPASEIGLDTARGILLDDTDATESDAPVQIAGPGVYRESDIAWPESITAAQKKAAAQNLRDRGLLLDVAPDGLTA